MVERARLRVVEDDEVEVISPGHARIGNGNFRPPVRGERRSPGRPAGIPNKMTRVIKEAALLAAEVSGKPKWVEEKRNADGSVTKAHWEWDGAEGLVGYMIYLAQNEAPTFTSSILSKIIPMQITTKSDDDDDYESMEDVADALRRKGMSASLVERLTVAVFEQRISQSKKRRRDEDD